MHDSSVIVDVLIPLALEQAYSYSAAPGLQLQPGDVVRVPLGGAERTGIVWRLRDKPQTPEQTLREVANRVEAPALPEDLRALIDWAADYTLSPKGSVLKLALNVALDACSRPAPQGFRATGARPERMTPARERVLAAASDGLIRRRADLAREAGVTPGVIGGLEQAGALERADLPLYEPFSKPDPSFQQPSLSEGQSAACAALCAAFGEDFPKVSRFQAALLDGVTGAGKTEVYFDIAAHVLAAGRQVLILLPEIALTSRFLDRFEHRFGARPAEWHSHMSARARERVWHGVRSGAAQAVIGARSALFLPFADLGLIVIDEEHEGAYKQDDGVPYHGRDIGVVRGLLGKIPVILSSATPSVESLVNARSGKYAHVRLNERHGGAAMPKVQLVDMRQAPPERGRFLSPVLIEALEQTFARNEQALLFLNRRGYAPLTLCRACGHRISCPHCDAWLVEHRRTKRLLCHHCGFETRPARACPACGADDAMTACGPGIERIAEEAGALFPEQSMAVLSSDLSGDLTRVRQTFRDIEAGRTDLVVGTQLVAKGHHFPGLTLVGVVDADLGLAMGDLRAAERSYQLVHQVAGRAGRAALPGRVILQTHTPEHPVLRALAAGDREMFYEREIEQRRALGLPPFGRLAAIVVSGSKESELMDFCHRMAASAPAAEQITVLGPAPAPLYQIRGRYRIRFLLKAAPGQSVQAYLRAWLKTVKPGSRFTLRIDVDPQSFL